MQSCWNFFVDILLNFCLADNTELLEILMNCVFGGSGQQKDKKLHLYIQNHPEYLPFLQSFTLKCVLSQA